MTISSGKSYNAITGTPESSTSGQQELEWALYQSKDEEFRLELILKFIYHYFSDD